VRAGSRSVERVITALRNVVSSRVFILDRLIHVPEFSAVNGRVEPCCLKIVDEGGGTGRRVEPGEMVFEEGPAYFHVRDRDKG